MRRKSVRLKGLDWESVQTLDRKQLRELEKRASKDKEIRIALEHLRKKQQREGESLDTKSSGSGVGKGLIGMVAISVLFVGYFAVKRVFD